MKKTLAYLIILTAFIEVLTGCGHQEAPYRKTTGAVWATAYTITYRSATDLDDSIQSVFRQVEESLSPFAPQSLISRVNRGETAETDSLLREVFRHSQMVNAASGGVFDPTVSPLINRWGFGFTDKDAAAPTQEEIDSLLLLVGIQECRLEGNQLVKKHEGTQFNFSAITKGYGCDLVGQMLERNGVTDYMVEIGGELALKGVNSRGEKWHVMIDAPIETDSVVHQRMALVEVTDCGIATSGNYRNHREVDGRRVGHTISPVTGQPIVTPTLSATVIAPSAMLADALATACMAMPLSDALAMVDSLEGCSALLVTAGDSLTPWALHPSRRFPPLK
ncbi:MAG: FAD:protein FMN transferase [Bacteroidales bacterium]|nr:FAD:protein FMN transferase [Bacteroidales bacterium]